MKHCVVQLQAWLTEHFNNSKANWSHQFTYLNINMKKHYYTLNTHSCCDINGKIIVNKWYWMSYNKLNWLGIVKLHIKSQYSLLFAEWTHNAEKREEREREPEREKSVNDCSHSLNIMWRDNVDHISPNRTILWKTISVAVDNTWECNVFECIEKTNIVKNASSSCKPPRESPNPDLFEHVPENCVNFRSIETNAFQFNEKQKAK